jgi:hypothetical protein
MEREQTHHCEFAQVGGRGRGRKSACHVNVSLIGEILVVPSVIFHWLESMPLSLAAKMPRRRVRRMRNRERRQRRKLSRKNPRLWTSLHRRNLLLLQKKPREQNKRPHKLYFYSCVNKVQFLEVYRGSTLSTLLAELNS